MKVYLVFGDPRNPEKRSIFERDLNPSSVEIFTHSARVITSVDSIEGGLIGSSFTGDGESNTGPYTSILVSEQPPSLAVKRSLEKSGWMLVTRYPYPKILPFLVQTTVILNVAGGYESWAKPMWFPHAFVPTQRSAFSLFGTHEVPVRCLSMTLRRDAPHQALFIVPDDGNFDSSFLKRDNWTRVPSNEKTWRILDSAAAAIEANVVNVLGATIVDSVTIHDINALQELEILRSLPGDVLDETILALYDCDREDLIPVEWRLDRAEDTN